MNSDAYNKLLAAMEQMLRDFEQGMAKPVFVSTAPGKEVVRFPKQDIDHAILLKLVMLTSGLNAALLLHHHGHVFEQAALQRMIDEASEDAIFLSLALIKQDRTKRHDDYLSDFWAEEWSDSNDVVASRQPRKRVPRDKISAYVARHHGGDWNTGHKTTMFLSAAYSGFVHGASPHLMDLYHEDRENFSVRGMLGTPRMTSSRHDLWNYLYRGGVAFCFAAAAFNSQQHLNLMRQHLNVFQKESGLSA
jgi:hypothetical protein